MNIGIIPARGGSKGIPRKNIKQILGFPLIYWSIEAAKESIYLDDFYVSTEDEEIARIAEKYGAKVLLRPSELAKDETTTISVLNDIVKHIKCDNIVVLQPTSPIRNFNTIDDCIKQYKSGNYDTLATGYYSKIIEYGTHQNIRRQDINGFFYDDGNIYIINSNLIKDKKWYGERVFKKINEKELNYEIDDLTDLKIVSNLLEERLIQGKQPSSFHKKLSNIKLLAMDVDGILTDAGMYYSEKGDELKKFNTIDGKGIELIRNIGVKTAIITSENTKIVERRAKKLKIDFLYQGIDRKDVIIKEIAKKQNINLNQIAYIGDDLNDISALKIVGFPITVKNARKENKSHAKLIVPICGGDGCVRYVCDLIVNNSTNK